MDAKSFKQSKIDGILTLNNLVYQGFTNVLQICDNRCRLMHPAGMQKRCKGAPDMLEHLRSLPASLKSRSAGDSTSFTVLPSHDDHALWMQKMDITPFDFSYLSSLLEQAYKDWINQNDTASDRPYAVYSVWNTEGECVGETQFMVWIQISMYVRWLWNVPRRDTPCPKAA